MPPRRSSKGRVPSLCCLSGDDWHLLVESVTDYAIFLLDPDGYITTWNLGAERIKGFTANEAIGQHLSMLFTREDVAAGKPERELALAKEHGRHEDEGWRIRKDGSLFWANAIVTTLRDEQGTFVGFAKITKDLTARHEKEKAERRLLKEQAAREAAEEAERRLRESEERYRTLSRRLEIVLEGVADGITVHDANGRIVFANTAAARACGFATGAELMATPLEEVRRRYEVADLDGHPVDAANLPAEKVLAGHEVGSVVLHVRERCTQREWWVHRRASAVLDSSGEPELAINIWHDVTIERRHARQARYLADATAALGGSLEDDEMLSTLASRLVPGLGDWCSVDVLVGEHLVPMALVHANRRGVEVTSVDPPKPASHRPDTNSAWSVVRSGAPAVFDATVDERDGSSADREAVRLLRSAGVRSAVIVPLRGRDEVLGAITVASTKSERQYDGADIQLLEEIGRRTGVALENARLFQSVQEAARAAEEGSRAKDEFLATVSHELRTPLSAIVGWSSILKSRLKDEAFIKPIEVIHRNALAQVKLIDDILDVSRVINGKFRIDAKPVDLVAIARDAIEVVRPAATSKDIAIQLDPADEICLMVADADRLQQVVWNLLSNAVKFTDSGGLIRLKVGQEGGKVVLAVSDTGKGIDPALLPHVFERFRQGDSTTTRRVGGLGLGLALVRHIVELHGGCVFVDSDGPGKGATFTISLPVRAVVPATVESAPPPRREETSADPSLQGVRVLVVDDESDARDMVASVLEHAGASVDTALSAADGYERFRASQPDVLISDIGMPDQDGYALMRRIRALPVSRGACVPSLALTAFARSEDRKRALAAGFTTHVGKPVDPEALVSAVADLAFEHASS